MKTFLQVESLIFSHSNQNNILLNNIFLKLSVGETVGLLGKNGSGKSTLLSILYGEIKADNIHFRVNERTILNSNNYSRYFYFVPQFIFLPKNSSLEKITKLTLDKNKQIQFFEDEIICKFKNSKIENLPYGIKKYIQIKLCMFDESMFCLLDEPYSGVSPLLCEKINLLIKKNSKNKGIIITDHNYNEIIKISDRIVLLKNGSLYNIKNHSELEFHNYLPV